MWLSTECSQSPMIAHPQLALREVHLVHLATYGETAISPKANLHSKVAVGQATNHCLSASGCIFKCFSLKKQNCKCMFFHQSFDFDTIPGL